MPRFLALILPLLLLAGCSREAATPPPATVAEPAAAPQVKTASISPVPLVTGVPAKTEPEPEPLSPLPERCLNTGS